MIDDKLHEEYEKEEYIKKLKELKSIRNDYLEFLNLLGRPELLRVFDEVYHEHKEKYGTSRRFKDRPSTFYWIRELRFKYQFMIIEDYIKQNNLIEQSNELYYNHKSIVEKIKKHFGS